MLAILAKPLHRLARQGALGYVTQSAAYSEGVTAIYRLSLRPRATHRNQVIVRFVHHSLSFSRLKSDNNAGTLPDSIILVISGSA